MARGKLAEHLQTKFGGIWPFSEDAGIPPAFEDASVAGREERVAM
ncbi:MAG: hypothetical protein ACR2N0_07555 [Rubrobacteraceae bacterium]